MGRLGGYDLRKDLEITTGRLRKSVFAGTTTFLLELKGPKRGPTGKQIERHELQAPLSDEVYRSLLPFADAGRMQKTRYSLKGNAIDSKLGEHPLTAQIDIVNAAGALHDEIERPTFATIDIELPHRRLLRSLRKGRHTFDVLRKDAVEISRAKRVHRNALSTKRIARDGIDRTCTTAIRRLLKKRTKSR